MCGHHLIYTMSTSNLEELLFPGKYWYKGCSQNTKNEVIQLPSPGITNILVFKAKANSILRIQKLEYEDEAIIQTIAKIIVSEIKNISLTKTYIKANLTSYQQNKRVRTMFAKLLSYISPGLSENTLPAILIGNLFLTDTVAFKWLCSHHSNGLVQAVADNFDCNISSMNGLKQTHSPAIMLLQQEQSASESTIQTETIPRMKKTELKDVHVPDILNQFNTLGPKKPDMPMKECIQKVPPLKVLAMAGTAIKVASEL